MIGVVRSNDLGGLSSADPSSEMVRLVAAGGDVRELQRVLWACAKRSPERRFRALYDRIWRGDVLWEAWGRVRKNRGAAGVDVVTLAEVEECGVERMLGELQGALREGRYRPSSVRRVAIPKPDGGKRPLGIPLHAFDRAERDPIVRIADERADTPRDERSDRVAPSCGGDPR